MPLISRWAIAFALVASTPTLAADPVNLTIRTHQTTAKVEVGIYGQFLEHIFHSVHGGLWGDQILNGTLELPPLPAGRGPATAPTTGPQASAETGGRGRGGRGANRATTPPRGWTFMGINSEVTNDSDNPFNAGSSIKIAMGNTPRSGPAPGIQQRGIALKEGERYTLTLYARGAGSVNVSLGGGGAAMTEINKELAGLTAEWQKLTWEFAATATAPDATMTIWTSGAQPINIDQVSLFSAATLANHKLRPDLYQAVADLKPASLRWPGGSFANNYIWQNAIGPYEKRLPHPVEQWNDRDTYHFGTDEFIQMCERLSAEPILVLNTARGVEDAMNWLEYCMGDESTPQGKIRAANGRRQPYKLNILEIDNETWLLMPYERYLQVVKDFCQPIRAKYPTLKLSVVGSYAYDTGPGEGRAEWRNANWDPRIIADAAQFYDILSPHYYNGLLREHPADFKDDTWKYGEFLQTRVDLIKKSANPNMKIYVSEWNLTQGPNDWRMGLYAAGILNEFERRAEFVTMACPALFMRKAGVTTSWNNALINFDQSRWFGGGNYVVNKLWRDNYAPQLLAIDGGNGKGAEAARPLSVVATKSEDNNTVYLKIVNPETTPTETTFTLENFTPREATMQLINPGTTTAQNSLDNPNTLKPTNAPVTRENNKIKVTIPALSAGVIKVSN